jgi:predicted nuclease of predicted toxin-antitoxin system
VRIVADESVDKQIVVRLRSNGHDVLYVAELDPGVDDESVLSFSRRANAILLTADKDFGELIFRQKLLHCGVLLIRLAGFEPDVKGELVATVFDQHADELGAGFAVLSKSPFGCGSTLRRSCA